LIVVLSALVLVVATIGLGALISQRGRDGGAASLPNGTVIVDEHFDDASNVTFSTDVDEQVALSVTGGAYRIEIKDPTYPQLMRHVESSPFGAARFEATVTLAPSSNGVSGLGLGCWTDDHAYVLIALTTGDIGIAERTESADQKMRQLSGNARPSSFRPGESNRLRFDCLGATATTPALLFAYVNSEPILSVKIEDGITSFDRVGFMAFASRAGSVFTVDNAYAVVERPAPPFEPVDPFGHEPPQTSSLATFDGFGVHFRYPNEWVEMGTQWSDPGISFGPASARADEWIAANMLSDRPSVDPGNAQQMARYAGDLFGDIVDQNGEGTGRLMGAHSIEVAGLPGSEGSIQGVTGPSGQELDVKLVVLFDGTTWYLLVCQYEPVAEAMMLPIWERALDSMQIDT
jgi:hypothetical protein